MWRKTGARTKGERSLGSGLSTAVFYYLYQNTEDWKKHALCDVAQDVAIEL